MVLKGNLFLTSSCDIFAGTGMCSVNGHKSSSALSFLVFFVVFSGLAPFVSMGCCYARIIIRHDAVRDDGSPCIYVFMTSAVIAFMLYVPHPALQIAEANGAEVSSGLRFLVVLLANVLPVHFTLLYVAANSSCRHECASYVAKGCCFRHLRRQNKNSCPGHRSNSSEMEML